MKQSFNPVKYFTALLILPLLVFVPIFGKNSATSVDGLASWTAVGQAALVYVPLFLVAIFYWSDGILKRDWQTWKLHWVRNSLWALLAMIFMLLVLVPITKAIAHSVAAGGTPDYAAAFLQTSLPTLLVLFVPLLQAFTEEIVYHHALVAPFAHNKVLYVAMSLVSNLVFAVVHINNVNGSVPNLILYLVMGIFFQLMYVFGNKNIWQNIMTHLFYNGLITVFGIVGILIMLFH